MSNVTAKEAFNTLKTKFNLQELKTLAFSVGIPYEDLEGNGRSGKALAMVQYSQRHGKFDQLIEEMYAPRDEDVTQSPSEDTSAGNVTYIVQGDMVQGDKVDGDKTEIGSISNSSGIAVGKDSSADTNTSNTYDMSGDFSGANLNINSSLENVTQTIGMLPNANEEVKAELQQLVSQLQETLRQVPPENEDEAEAVAELTETLLDTANKERPNKQLIQITGEGLKQAAKNLAAIVPDVVKISGAIVSTVLAL